MKSRHSNLYIALLSAMAVLPVVAQAQSPALAGINTAEAPRVTQAVDNNVVTPIRGSHLAMLEKKAPIGSVADATSMNHMQLILKPSALRQAALEGLSAAQHDRKSSKFHQWITPEEFGANFGVADADIATTTKWLVAQGFTVNAIYPNKLQIDFSGTAGQVKAAFHTQESRYTIAGESHIANAGDISFPNALKPVVAGIAGLNDVHPHPALVAPRVGQFNPASGKINNVQAPPKSKGQAINFTNGARGLVPYDLNKMYGVTALHAAGVSGQGITIAVVEDGSMVPADWTNFVAQFDLGSYGGTFAQIQPQPTPNRAGPVRTNCVDPTLAFPGEDDGETLLDAEWSTAMAPSANIEVASCDDSNGKNFFGGVFTAATNLINGATRPNIISASYGYGEGFTDSASKTAIDLMWAQADAEGISVFVSSGDSGSNPSFNGGIINSANGIDANAFGTSIHDTVVGGTDTADVLRGTTSQYFSTHYNSVYGSALSYVPEIPWNQSCGNTTAATAAGYASALAFCKAELASDPDGFTLTSEAGSGGPSSVDAKPAWQRQIWGAAKDESRDVPDVALFAGSYGGDTYVIVCEAAYPCSPGFPGLIALSGGTSLASPMMAGVQALIDQGLAAKGLPVDQGNAAPTLYALAAEEYGGSSGTPPATLATCSADNGATGTSKCVFHNVTSSGISTQCIQQLPNYVTPDCYFYGTVANLFGFYGPFQVGLTSRSTTSYSAANIAFPSKPGWSFAAGLGSVNAYNLLAAWKAFEFVP
jgi:subtilase family serine protease